MDAGQTRLSEFVECFAIACISQAKIAVCGDIEEDQGAAQVAPCEFRAME